MAKFYGIGVGPGEEELITLKAVKVLGELDIVMIPETKKGEPGVAYQIIEKYLKPTIQKQFVYFPMVKEEAVFEKVGKETAEQMKVALNDLVNDNNDGNKKYEVIDKSSLYIGFKDFGEWWEKG